MACFEVLVARDTCEEKADWMKRAVFLATTTLLLAMLFLAPMAVAQGTTFFDSASPTAPSSSCPGACTGLGSSGGPSILLPAAALLLGSGILTYAILRRR